MICFNPDRKVILVLISDLSAQVSLARYIVFPVHRCLDFRDAAIILHSDSPDAWLVTGETKGLGKSGGAMRCGS
jgi:hypothetical protein